MGPLNAKVESEEDGHTSRTSTARGEPESNKWTFRKVTAVVAASLVCGRLAAHGLGWYGLPRNVKQAPGSPREFDWDTIKPHTELNWHPCYEGQECARLLLPLDYTNTSDTRTVAIALHSIPAPTRGTSAHRGAVFFNPGGPGEPGTHLTVSSGRALGAIIGEGYDVLGFDPRGTGASIPRVDCFKNQAEREIWGVQGGYLPLNVSDDTFAMYRARERLVGQRCEEQVGGEGGITRFVGTPSVARDMLEIAKKLGQEKMNYWGFSYGTVLGQYFAAMFPDKVGRFIIDGVFDANTYRDTLWPSYLVDMEEVINSLFQFCHQAGPERCPIYESTPSLIRARYFRTLDALKLSPIPISTANPPLVVTHSLLTAQLVLGAYTPPRSFPIIASTVHALETDDQEALIELISLTDLVPPLAQCNCSQQSLPWFAPNEAFYAVACGDSLSSGHFDPDLFAKIYEDLVADSPQTGAFAAAATLKCADWPTRATWRYTGPLEARGENATASPMLILQPRWDPVCPLRDARAVLERYDGAAILVQESYGHCSLAAPSVCTARRVRAYFQDGTLPEEGAVCDVDELPFVGRIPREAMDAKEEELVWATRKLVDAVPRFGML